MQSEAGGSSNQGGSGDTTTRNGGGGSDAGECGKRQTLDVGDHGASSNKDQCRLDGSQLTDYHQARLRGIFETLKDRWDGDFPWQDGPEFKGMKTSGEILLDADPNDCQMTLVPSRASIFALNADPDKTIAKHLDVSQESLEQAWTDMWQDGWGYFTLLRLKRDDSGAEYRATGMSKSDAGGEQGGVVVEASITGSWNSVKAELRFRKMDPRKEKHFQDQKSAQIKWIHDMIKE